MIEECLQVYRCCERSARVSKSLGIVVWFAIQVEIKEMLNSRLDRVKGDRDD
jgi:hypothetical protein